MARQWRAPHRPDNEITQEMNSGVVKIYSVEDSAQPGYQPKPSLTLKLTLRYEEQRLGINRLYLSRQNQAEIEKVIRVPRQDSISNQDVAILESGSQYSIDYTQTVQDVYPPCLDLSLVKVEQNYEVPS
ncbi:hypothetical protein [Roseburia hominis]|uniref:hypothetical protein n=1 Tax=Roseburia hominis TaxID=301301 RepID=UPI0024327FF6|nr:hypothetical protein [Roseburia hominis]